MQKRNLDNKKLIEDIRDPLISYLLEEPNETLVKLAMTCRFFRNNLSKKLAVRKRSELLRRIICGEESEAKTMLEGYPELLKDKLDEAMDYSRRKIKNLTPFQAALCAGDTRMCKMIEKIFLAYSEKTGGRVEMSQQFTEIFPEKKGDSKFFPEAEGGLAGHLERQKKNVFNFDAIISAFNSATKDQVIKASNNDGAQFTETEKDKKKLDNDPTLTLSEALNRFRDQFSQKSHDEIIFNPQHLLMAFEIYKKQFNVWDSRKCDLFWRQIIGFVQRFLSAIDAQVFTQGIYCICNNETVLPRTFNFRISKMAFYPIHFDSCSGLGFDYACALGGIVTRDAACLSLGCSPVIRFAELYEFYIKQKYSVLETYVHQSMVCSSQI